MLPTPLGNGSKMLVRTPVAGSKGLATIVVPLSETPGARPVTGLRVLEKTLECSSKEVLPQPVVT